jgi:hypothetical protein
MASNDILIVYYVRADNDDGENQDLHVVAANKDDAETCWRKEYDLHEDKKPEWIAAIPGVTTTREAGPIVWAEIN